MRFELLLKSAGEAIYGVDMNGCCTFVNKKFLQLLGYTSEELLGKNLHNLIHHTRTDGSPYPWGDCFINQCLGEGVSYTSDTELVWRKDGSSFPAVFTINAIIERENVTGGVVIVRDITEAHALSSKLHDLARHDSLTGLVNRREFEEHLEQVLEHTRHSDSQHALCYLDLDKFKVINDSCGHLAGDELLRQIAGVLNQHIRKRDFIARLGGDEFGVLMEDCSSDEAKHVAQSIRDAVTDYRFRWEDKTHAIGVSIGIVAITEDSGSLSDVLKAADAACYAAKENGRNRFHVYNEEDTAVIARQGEMQWVDRINRALEDNGMRLYVQPIAPVSGVEGEKIFYEVLLRMHENEGDIILPENFLGSAERYNLSIKIDRWVVSNFFKWLSKNTKKLESAPLFTVNLSGQSLADKDFMDFTIAEFEKYRVPPQMICFEITETAAITNLDRANQFMDNLKELGCSFALDDFGTGLSSFGYLKTLPVDYLKIGGLFVKDIMQDDIQLAMVKSINEIGQVMGKKTIAECVESAEILAQLIELGVNYAQGYAIGKPEPLENLIV
jgi:two-component system CheB/CheR fusion protein